MTIKLAERAVRIANNISRHDTRRDTVRDRVDLMTGGELDCQPLDILTDMVVARLRSYPAPDPRNTPTGHPDA